MLCVVFTIDSLIILKAQHHTAHSTQQNSKIAKVCRKWKTSILSFAVAVDVEVDMENEGDVEVDLEIREQVICVLCVCSLLSLCRVDTSASAIIHNLVC